MVTRVLEYHQTGGLLRKGFETFQEGRVMASIGRGRLRTEAHASILGAGDCFASIGQGAY